MKIFINLPTWLGDSVMASAALRLIFSHFERLVNGTIQSAPNATNSAKFNDKQELKFILYGSFVACELFKDYQNAQICVQTPKKRGILGALARFKDLYKLAKNLGEFDYAFSFRSAFSVRILLFLISSKHKFIFDKKQDKNAHQVLKYLAFVQKALDTKAQSNELFLPMLEFKGISSKERQNLLGKFGISTDKKWLGINAGAKYGLAKCWDKEYFAQVGFDFSSTHKILIFGTSFEQEICDDIELWLAKKGVKAHNLCGKTSIKELCELISALDLFVSNDSGAMHIAAFYKTPTIAVFGPTRFTQTSPWRNENARLVHLNLPCMPCMKRVCPLKHHACMKDLKPELVINAAKNLLAQKQGKFIAE